MNKKGFLIRFSRIKKRVISIKTLKSKYIVDISQNENQEFIIFIYVNKSALLLSVVHGSCGSDKDSANKDKS